MLSTKITNTRFGTFIRLYTALLLSFATAVAVIAAVGYPLTAIIVACVFTWSLERTAKYYMDTVGLVPTEGDDAGNEP